ncbi:protein tincar isoform X1 [Temnothorax curvispinosus]|uniref:Protein tincar isoform X1 n=1 Tax=Temnothorax curvispinosus TaxID=300111 RepID=A0A6J1PFU4_9HYME|nr:protein tincar isoform X1 [Temnothorax curvispinosus]XP_024868299.1 protein tincar isoform X1 [Temnothorax curvispinosus]XP_024868300.1 protein tincar isoform X1 [Temnothorax curvispinosus]XP_024868301.1 protein tincar isoform X1 [Temnothorax curvispinosus]XP_024868305.1 protein tincar isoform X1 [Temnothorax curvispinosus]
MSMTGSLMGYENNNDVNQAKCKKPLKPLPVVSSISSGGVTTSTGKSKRARKSTRKESCIRGHVNSLWSVWYGILAVAFQAYIAMRYARRFAAYLSLPWPADAPPPKIELYACLVLAGTGVVLLPVLLGAAFLKLGNLANDGIKLGRHLSACSRDPPSSLLTNNPDNSLVNNLWRHGGPTAAFVHLCTAMCFLLPSLLMEARLIHAGFLPKDAIWRTDLDWMVIHRDRLVLLSFMNPIGNFSTMTGSVTPQPFVTPEDGINENLDDLTTPTSSLTNIPDALPDAVETRTETTTRFSTVLHPIVTDPSSSHTTSISSTIPSKSTTSTEAISTTPKTTSLSKNNTVRRPTMKPITRNGSSKNRSKAKNLTRLSTTAKPAKAVGGNMTAQTMSLTMNSLADLDHPENLNLELQAAESYGPITLEYLNYAVALGVYSVRYPAVFWSCNKALGTIFSLQLVVNSAQSLLAYAGMSVLYKVQVVGALKVLPHLRHRTVPTTSTISTIFGDSYFLLDPPVTLVLFALLSFLVLCSSMVMYFYAHGRFTAFLNQERERRVILSKDGREGNGWVYLPHCAAFVVFLAIVICGAPLLYDYTVVYRGSLDGAILACIIGMILHLLLWLLLWIFLTIKQRWTFKLRVTIGRATVRSARSVKLVTDVDLLSARDDEDGTNAPLLVVGNGRTYTIADTSPKRAIMNVIQKAAMERKARSQGGNVDGVDGESTADGDEQIYWLRPKLRPSPTQSPSDTGGAPTSDKGWKKLKHKVTFNDLPSTSGSRNKGKARRGVADGGPDDDGDYATLRELPLITSLDPADDSTSEENKLLECVNDDQVTYYASASRDLQPSEGDPSPLLTPDPLPDPAEEPLPLPPPTPTSAPTTDIATAPLTTNVQMNGGQTPRCLRRADSGMPHEELTPRSDSSNSPPLDAVGSGGGAGSVTGHSNTSSNSETSSGVHSNASNASNASHSSSQRRATSVDDLTGEPREEPREQWRSCSLQRGTQPPTANTTFSPPSSRPGTSQSFSSPQYVNHVPPYSNTTSNEIGAGCPAVILENPNEATVVIRRKLSRTKLTDPLNPNEEPFGRSTNMRMTSFTESNDIRIQASSATLPHYPTQPIVTYPHCSTMPLPHASHSVAAANMSGGSTGSCGSVPRHTFVPPQVHTTMPAHTTLPSHHNGVRLLHATAVGPGNPFVKRFPPVQLHTQPWALPGHHTFPQMPQGNSKLTATAQIRQSDRDSANFSMASSGDSDTCLPH